MRPWTGGFAVLVASRRKASSPSSLLPKSSAKLNECISNSCHAASPYSPAMKTLNIPPPPPPPSFLGDSGHSPPALSCNYCFDTAYFVFICTASPCLHAVHLCSVKNAHAGGVGDWGCGLGDQLGRDHFL
jgi:hypothetical protein